MNKATMSDVATADVARVQSVDCEALRKALPVAGHNFESRKVHFINESMYCVKPSIFALAFCLLFALPGVLMVTLWIATALGVITGPGSFPMLLLGLLFTAAGIGLYYSINEQVILEKKSGIAFIQSWLPSGLSDSKNVFKRVVPEEMSAVQAVSRLVKHRSNRSIRRSSYTEYQVNVCLVTGERRNLFITLKPERAEKFAECAALLYQVPLWKV